MFEDYEIWRYNHSQKVWIKTSHKLKARTDKEAQSVVKRKFAGAGFSSMSLVAVKPGTDSFNITLKKED